MHHDNTSSHTFLVAKDCRTMTSGWQGAPHLRGYGRRAGFETGDFVEEKLGGGLTVERLSKCPILLFRSSFEEEKACKVKCDSDVHYCS